MLGDPALLRSRQRLQAARVLGGALATHVCSHLAPFFVVDETVLRIGGVPPAKLEAIVPISDLYKQLSGGPVKLMQCLERTVVVIIHVYNERARLCCQRRGLLV